MVKERTDLFPHNSVVYSGLSLGHNFSAFEVRGVTERHQTILVGFEYRSSVWMLAFDEVVERNLGVTAVF